MHVWMQYGKLTRAEADLETWSKDLGNVGRDLNLWSRGPLGGRC